MLPPILAHQIQDGVADFLRSTFPSANPFFASMLDRFLAEPGMLFKGPYHSLKLPFRPGTAGTDVLKGFTLPFPPYLHQQRAFERLRGEKAKPTLVATGTGSGKTECFLYPILEHCLSRPADRGIKAVIIYPMNALATDQAKRLAGIIEDQAKGKITAGLYVGGEAETSTEMTKADVITDRYHLRDSPPDILLTNYKMLDYLLIRQQDFPLWAENGPETLRYLVVDELHTFDGAQGTDLACLVRRLKARLAIPEGHLCCVGTSATLGAEAGLQALADYATRIFGEAFDSESVITETLLNESEFLGEALIAYTKVPDAVDVEQMRPENFALPEDYLKAQYQLWIDEPLPDDLDDREWRVTLGEQLKQHSFFRNLLTVTRRGLMTEEALSYELGQGIRTLREAPDEVRHLVTISLLSLVAHARGPGGKMPLVQQRAQLWLRELARLVASVTPEPILRFSDDLEQQAAKIHLPVLHCRDCGATGWGGTMRANEHCVTSGLQEFYRSFFDEDSKLRFFFPSAPGFREVQGEQLDLPELLCGSCLYAGPGHADGTCPACQAEGVLIPGKLIYPTKTKAGKVHTDKSCPYCDSETGLTIMGSRAASLTSVVLGQTFASPYNDHKQTLAFSDSVQDASHRAGFFSARTWRMNLRTAMQKVLQEHSNPVVLSELHALFETRWRMPGGDAQFAGIFTPPEIEWKEAYETLEKTGHLPTDSNFAQQVSRRVSWEITGEFGFQARIGRTLEKSGTAILVPDADALNASLEQMLPRLKESIGTLRSLDSLTLRRVVLGLLARLRTTGGIFHPELDGYVAQMGNTFSLGKTHDHLPGFRGRGPSYFIGPDGDARRFERLWATGSARTWAQKWLSKALPAMTPPAHELAKDILPVILQALERSGLLEKRAAQGVPIWGLLPARLLVHQEVHQLACAHCGHAFACASTEVTDWDGMPCLRLDCGGTYHPTRSGPDYYGRLYASGDVERIRAREHTGLLERGEREELERRFQRTSPDRLPTDPNLLSCTPTLEMGINIGDLSTLFLCSVPPGQANYLQRIGRAGRRDGNAFNLTVADARAHSLYYFEEPLMMMAGDVPMPGVFLDAPAVLERQFTAFCFDRWVAGGLPKDAVPKKLDTVLNNLERAPDLAAFPHSLLRFIESNLTSLVEGFLAIFRAGDLRDDAAAAIRTFAEGKAAEEGSLAWKISRCLETLRAERSDLRDRLRKLQNAIKRNKSKTPRDETLDAEQEEMQRDRSGLHELLKRISSKDTLEVFTDEGLLPNYAFPEEGVTLHSIILRKKAEADEHGAYSVKRYDYERPAAVALTELAPGNTFYAGGRKLTIDQVSVGLSPVETWHFCDECSYIERHETGSPIAEQCPRCQSSNWSDTSLLKPMLRMRQVVTTVTDRDSRIRDDADERELHFFNRHISVDLDVGQREKAYQLTDIAFPFGFEFIRKVTLREVNLGPQELGAEVLKIGGREHQGHGFRICAECGKVQTAKNKQRWKHDISCGRRGKETEEEVLEAVFLYRELSSEALRILIPSAGGDMDVRIASFLAAVYVGLREHFGGNIDHLESCIQELPIPEAPSLRRRYLILYDKVPGGTGYLKELMRSPDGLLNVLRKAQASIATCGCEADTDKDGCHRCVRAYRLRRDHPRISRRQALEVLNALLSDSAKLEEVSGGLSTIDVNPLVKSELEQRFLEALKAKGGFKMETRVVRGHPGYLLSGPSQSTSWEIAPQVDVTKKDGAAIHSRPDFVFYPLRSGGATSLAKPIAVFLDGFTFHADVAGGHNRIGVDLGKRMAILHGAGWHVWSVTWADVHAGEDAKEHIFKVYGEALAAKRDQMLGQILEKDRREKCGLVDADKKNSLELLFAWLRNPDEFAWEIQAAHYGLFFGTLGRCDSSEIEAFIHQRLGSAVMPRRVGSPAEVFRSQFNERGEDGHTQRIEGTFWIPGTDLACKKFGNAAALIWFNDTLENGCIPSRLEWAGMLRLVNLLQFMPGFHAVSTAGLAGGWCPGVLDALLLGPSPKTQSESGIDHAWVELFELTDRGVHELLKSLATQKVLMPDAGYELLGPTGTIVAAAELAWESLRVAVLLNMDSHDTKAFIEQGWTVFGCSSPEEQTTITSFIISAS
ncbi:MAG: DEAD/DEAH box helicase [Verrucomicrobiaceae bacterium]|nr:DEAD/DEAH box helicase [Verrucomicrobiaceae bacterium]